MAGGCESQGWFALFCRRAPPEEVAEAMVSSYPREVREKAAASQESSYPLVQELRGSVVASRHRSVREDAEDGWRYTGSVMRAVDKALGIPPPVPRTGPVGPDAAAEGGGAELPTESRRPGRGPICILRGGGSPGSLGLWWSDFAAASNTAHLRLRCRVTHRLNVAAEVEAKLPLAGRGDKRPPLVTAHVPMQDFFTDDEALHEEWVEQFKEVLVILRAWCAEGAVVNVSCQMGKNRSGCALLAWLVSDGGWDFQAAVAHLRQANALALANPYLLAALGQAIGVDGRAALNPGHDGGGWVCISPPGSPRTGGGGGGASGVPQPSFEALVAEATEKLAADPRGVGASDGDIRLGSM